MAGDCLPLPLLLPAANPVEVAAGFVFLMAWRTESPAWLCAESTGDNPGAGCDESFAEMGIESLPGNVSLEFCVTGGPDVSFGTAGNGLRVESCENAAAEIRKIKHPDKEHCRRIFIIGSIGNFKVQGTCLNPLLKTR